VLARVAGSDSVRSSLVTLTWSSAMTATTWLMTPAIVSPGRIRKFTTPRAVDGRTFSLTPASRMVGAIVVRTSGLVSWRASMAPTTSEDVSHKFERRVGRERASPAPAFRGSFASRGQAPAERMLLKPIDGPSESPHGSLGRRHGGVAALGLRDELERQVPFSETETEATGRSMPGTMPCVTAPPSSITHASFTPRRASSSAIFLAPLASADFFVESRRQGRGCGSDASPRRTSDSRASKSPMSDPLSSIAPRPNESVGDRSSNGGCVHLDSVPGSMGNHVLVGEERIGSAADQCPATGKEGRRR